METQLKSVSLFSGIGGISIGNPMLYVEKDSHCQRVLRARFADGCLKPAPIHNDITTLKELPIGCELLYGGSPCQDFSSAGTKMGVVNGPRSSLFFDMARLAFVSRPKYVFFENVANLRNLEESWKTILVTLHRIGYDCRWSIVTAEAAGAPHLRSRWFMLCTLVRDANDAAELPLPGKQMHACGELVDGAYNVTESIAGNPRPLSIRLLPLKGPKSSKSTNLITMPVKRKRWATCRAYGGGHPACELTKRCSADLSTMLRFAESTPEEDRWKDHSRPNADWVDWMMGFPVGWSNHARPVKHVEHSFVEDKNVRRLILSNIPNSHRLQMLGNACVPQQANLAFVNLWQRSSGDIPPTLLTFPPRSEERPTQKQRTGDSCQYCDGTGTA